MRLLHRILRFIAFLVYPPRCPLCDCFVQERHASCAACEVQLVRTAGDAFINLQTSCWFERARSCFAFEGRLKDAVHAYKYAGRLDLAGFFVAHMTAELARAGEIDLIVSVPPDRARLRTRGFDPCALLARRMAGIAGASFLPRALHRTRHVMPQVGLARVEREQNVHGVFAVISKARSVVDGARVLVVDDVLTTGATANDCARALSKAGAAEVTVLTIARTL
jgi:ComF family protein